MVEAETIHETAIANGGIYHSLEVVKNTKGYNWSVKVAGGDYDAIKKRLVEAEEFCHHNYGNKE
jgi:hypothetical protein